MMSERLNLCFFLKPNIGQIERKTSRRVSSIHISDDSRLSSTPISDSRRMSSTIDSESRAALLEEDISSPLGKRQDSLNNSSRRHSFHHQLLPRSEEAKKEDVKSVRAQKFTTENPNYAVLKVFLQSTMKISWLKIIYTIHQIPKRDTDKGMRAAILEELGILAAIKELASIKQHRNIVKFFGICDIEDKICFLTEHCSKGSLDKLHDKMDLTLRDRSEICKQKRV